MLSPMLNIVFKTPNSTGSILLFKKEAIGNYNISKKQHEGQSICHLLCLLTTLNSCKEWPPI